MEKETVGGGKDGANTVGKQRVAPVRQMLQPEEIVMLACNHEMFCCSSEGF